MVWCRRDDGYIGRRMPKMPGEKEKRKDSRRFIDEVREDMQVVGGNHLVSVESI